MDAGGGGDTDDSGIVPLLDRRRLIATVAGTIASGMAVPPPAGGLNPAHRALIANDAVAIAKQILEIVGI